MIIAHQKTEILLYHANVLMESSKAQGKWIQEINRLEALQEEFEFHIRKTVLF